MQKEINSDLLWAVQNNDFYGIKNALKLGADPNMIDTRGNTPLMIISDQIISTEMIKTIQKAKDRMLEEAVWSNNFSDTKKALELGADPNTRDVNNITPLMTVSDTDCVEILRLLIKHGADVNAVSGSGATSLHRAIFWLCNDAAQALIQAGADVNIQDIYGDTPLMRAGMAGNIEGMIMLVRAGADTSIRNKNGQTAQEVLEANCPDKYSEWISYMKRIVLSQEDAAACDTLCGPDFSL